NLKTQFGDSWDKNISSFVVDINMCYIFYELPNLKGKKELVCSSRDLRVISGKVQSISKTSDEDYKLVAYDQTGQKGNSITLSQREVLDLNSLGWGNKIQSV
ncbi:MAG: hypothetical protein ACKO96_09230, partial [Flammeovirgaceae bacterium]